MPKQIVLSKQDYYLITTIIDNPNGFSKYCSAKLGKELKTAEIMHSLDIPDDVVKINSVVKILELEEKFPVTIKIVKPTQADAKQNRISIQAPLGAALIGYKKGDTVVWEMPAGLKRLRILDVRND